MKSKWCYSLQEIMRMVLSLHGMRPADSEITVAKRLSSARTVEDLRPFLGTTGYLRPSVERYREFAAPVTDILRNKRFDSKRTLKMPIPWTPNHENVFQALKASILSSRISVIPAWGRRSRGLDPPLHRPLSMKFSSIRARCPLPKAYFRWMYRCARSPARTPRSSSRP